MNLYKFLLISKTINLDKVGRNAICTARRKINLVGNVNFSFKSFNFLSSIFKLDIMFYSSFSHSSQSIPRNDYM